MKGVVPTLVAFAVLAAGAAEVKPWPKADTAWMPGSVGVSVHWTAALPSASGKVTTFEEAVNGFDVPRFVNAIAAVGARHLIFTTAHAYQMLPMPNAALDAIAPGRTTKRDLFGEILDACAAKGIRVIAYYNHSCNGEPKPESEWQANAGEYARQVYAWMKLCRYPFIAGGDADVFASNYCAIVGDISRRYGTRISGWWFDSPYSVDSRGPNIQAIGKWRKSSDGQGWVNAEGRKVVFPWAKLVAAAKSGNPRAAVAVNAGCGSHFQYTELSDYCAGEVWSFDETKFPAPPRPDLVDTRWACVDDKLWTYNRKRGFMPLYKSVDYLVRWTREQVAANRMVTFNVLIDRDGNLSPVLPKLAPCMASAAGDRLFWVRTMERIADPVVTHLAANTLVGSLRERPGAATNPYRHLECVGRTFNGILPFMNLPDDDTYEGRLRARWRPLILKGIANAVTPGSHDLLEWKKHGQPLVDAAFFAQGLLRAPKIWDALPDEVKENVVARLRETRTTDGYENNWEFFGGTIEAFFLAHGYPVDEKRLLRGLDHFCPAEGDPSGNGWYAGDGLYGDGKNFHLDYYNSYVIQPMMATVLDVLLASGKYPQYAERRARIQARFRRCADIQERLIAPDGTYPLVGRSITYRFGAFHHLATSYTRGGDWQGQARPGAVRAALTAVLKRQSGDSNFTSDGWLTVGWNGEQVSLADNYISPGSVYLCTFVFQPLSLPPTAPFWTDPASDWTQKAAWSGKSVPADHAIE